MAADILHAEARERSSALEL